MEITSEEVRAQIDRLKWLIEKNEQKELIKSEQIKLNAMLKEYLENRN